MCGIVGYSINNEKKFFSEEDDEKDLSEFLNLDSATSSLSHRGPDDEGTFIDKDKGIGLGHRRLSIIDLSSEGHQPMLSSDKSITLVFNGEIYNYLEIKKELKELGHIFSGNSDTEVLLHLYQEEGEKMLSRLNGIFTFALFDKTKDSLLIARDALGVKPLYFHEEDGLVSFSSEIKSLLKLSKITKKINYQSLDRYLSFLWCPGNGTPLSEVSKLGPGEAMWVHKGKVTNLYQWYKLPILTNLPKISSYSEALNGTVNHLKEAVRRQMVSDVPLGAFLSGGLDSSSIVAFAKEINSDIKCFTIEPSGGEEQGMQDDLPYAKKVAKHLKVPLEIVQIDSAKMASDFEKMVIQLDEPLADPAPLNVLYICQLAKEQGIKVLLSGAGGDDLFTGYRRHIALDIEKYWKWLPKSLRSNMEAYSRKLNQNNPFNRRLSKIFSNSHLEGDARIVNYFSWSRREDLIKLYSKEFIQELDGHKVEEPFLDLLSSFNSSDEDLDRILALEQRFFLTDHNLLYTDKMSMATGVEVRVPFLDKDLLNFSAQIPNKFKVRRFQSKWILKKAMEPFLPKEVIYRPKTGFGAPLRRWMRYELREMLGDLLSTDNISKRGIFDPIEVHKLIAANDKGQIDASYTLLSLLAIEIWCNHYIDEH